MRTLSLHTAKGSRGNWTRVRHFADLDASEGYAFGHGFQALWQICHQFRSAI